MTTRHGGVVVTGGAGGIGAAVAEAFASAGYGVVVSDIGVSVSGDHPSAEPAQQLVDRIRACGGRSVARAGSVTEMAVAEDLVATAVAEYGSLDALVTCHGILRERMIFNMSEAEWDSVVDVHLRGTFTCFRAATAQMRQQRNGAIVALSSTAGLEGSPAQANYAAAKAGIVGLVFSTALAMGRYGVSVNCIVPSADTRMTARISDLMSGARAADDRKGPELIGALALALADPRCRDLTGQLITATGNRLALWQPPTERDSVALSSTQPPQEEVIEAIHDRLKPGQLRRFAALNLPLPASSS